MDKLLNFLDFFKWFGLRKIYWVIRRFFVGNFLITPDLSQKIIHIFDGYVGHNASYKNAFLGLGIVHYSLVRNTKPKNILCVGSRKGFIPAVLALACKDNGRGLVDFVDAGYGDENPEKSWTGIGFWKNINPKSHFEKLGVSKQINTYVMTTKEYLKKFPGKKFQYIYIDGDHSYAGVSFDYKNFWKRLERGGFISFHDIDEEGKKPEGVYGVKKLWQEIAKSNFIELTGIGSGLGIIQKK